MLRFCSSSRAHLRSADTSSAGRAAEQPEHPVLLTPASARTAHCVCCDVSVSLLATPPLQTGGDALPPCSSGTGNEAAAASPTPAKRAPPDCTALRAGCPCRAQDGIVDRCVHQPWLSTSAQRRTVRLPTALAGYRPGESPS